MKFIKTTNTHNDFIKLTKKLDTHLNNRYKIRQKVYTKQNIIDTINTVLILYIDDTAVACGCFREISSNTIEIKRMYVEEAYRGKGLSISLLNALELWGSDLGYSKSILETGIKQLEAISLYNKCQYKIIDNYGVYKDMRESICMQKLI